MQKIEIIIRQNINKNIKFDIKQNLYKLLCRVWSRILSKILSKKLKNIYSYKLPNKWETISVFKIADIFFVNKIMITCIFYLEHNASYVFSFQIEE